MKIETQYDASRGEVARGTTMDAVVEDNRGRTHNLEIQLDARGLVPERGRYHAGILDVGYLSTGEDFTQLPETYVIFICDHIQADSGDTRSSDCRVCRLDSHLVGQAYLEYI